ncbi:GtrA family protein [Sinomonas humi]|nr:GtrA family protein [Sinomonas humi]
MTSTPPTMTDGPRPNALTASPRWGRVRGAVRRPVVRQLVRFTGVGIICTAASMGLYAGLRFPIGPTAANATALIVTSLLNTELNRRFTFRIHERRRRLHDHLHGLVALVIALVLTSGSLWALLWAEPNAGVVEELWTTTLAGWVATAARFVLLRYWVFRRARNA